MIIEVVKILVICIMPEDVSDRDCCGGEDIAMGYSLQADDAEAPLVHGTKGARASGSLSKPPRVHQESIGSHRSSLIVGLTGGRVGTEQAIADSRPLKGRAC